MRPPIDDSSVRVGTDVVDDVRRTTGSSRRRIAPLQSLVAPPRRGFNARFPASIHRADLEPAGVSTKCEEESAVLCERRIQKRGPLQWQLRSVVAQCDPVAATSQHEELEAAQAGVVMEEEEEEGALPIARSLSRDGQPQRHHHFHRPRNSSRNAANVRRRPTRGPIQNPVEMPAVACGIAAGIAQAGMFNPYDRALYLSIKNRRPFLSPHNWTSPYTGFLQSLGNRALAGGLYYPLEHYFLRLLNRPNESSTGANLAAGALAGACNAVVLNPITVVKYRTWGFQASSGSSETATRGWFREAWYVLNSAKSPRPFYNGLASTLMRDVAFGGVYTGCRLQIQWYADLSPDRQWQGNMVSAGLATILASPFNYARSVQYATSSRQLQPSTAHVLRDLARHVVEESDGTWLHRLRILQVRLRVGWGTLRVAMGMSFAHAVYDALQKQVRPYT